MAAVCSRLNRIVPPEVCPRLDRKKYVRMECVLV